ncbi:MAG: hypothetical protein DA408_20300, partial [Bacteroidetes bacterium]
MDVKNFTHYSRSLLATLFFSLLFTGTLAAQFNEDFEDETTVGATTFTGGGVTFNTTGTIAVGFFMNGGCGGSRYIEGSTGGGAGASAGEIQMQTANKVFRLNSMCVWLSTDGGNTASSTTFTLRGSVNGGGIVDALIVVVEPCVSDCWTPISIAGTALDGLDLTKVEALLPSGFNYIAIDNFNFTQSNANAVNVSINDVTLAEGNSGNTAFNFTVTRTNNNTAFSVTAQTANGLATAGTDYTALAATLVNFTMGGALTQTVTVNVSGDVDPEATENFFVNLSAPTNGAMIIDSQGEGTITDDDTICETFEDEMADNLTAFSQNGISFTTTGVLQTGYPGGGSSSSDTYLESNIAGVPHAGSVGQIQITTAGKVFEVLRMDLYLSTDNDPNTAETASVNFVGTLAAGGTVTVTRTTTDPTNWSQDISFSGTLLDGALLTALEVVLPAGVNYFAMDDFKFAAFDNTAVLVSINDVSQNEGNAGPGNFTFTVTRSLNTTAFSVDVQSAVGGAIPATVGTDYVALGLTTLNFTANGALSQTVNVVVNGDTDSEFPENFFVNLSNPTNGAIISGGQGLGTILDDDTVCETFEDEAAANLMAFSENGVSFSTTGELVTGFFAPGGGGSGGSDYYLESDIANVPHAGSVGFINLATTCTSIRLLRMDVWLSTDGDPETPEASTVQLIGTLVGGGTATVDLPTTNTSNWTQNISFVGTAFDGVDLTAIEVVLTGGSNYVAFDNICFEATLPNLVLTCPADPATIAGCSTADIQPTSTLPFSNTLTAASLAELQAEGGDATSGNTITTITYQDAITSTAGFCPIVVTRTWTVTDDCPSTQTCTQTFTINDTQAPAITTCPPMLTVEGCTTADVNADGTTSLAYSPGGAPVSNTAFGTEGGTFLDNCTVTFQYQDVAVAGTCPTKFVITRTFIIMDGCGNVSDCNQVININDDTAPTITCPGPIGPIEGCDENDITVATAGFAYSATPVTVPAAQFPGTIDVEACGAATATYVDVITDSSCPNPVLSVTRTWTVADDCGNTSLSCTQLITVADNTAPVITCPNPIGPIGPIDGCDENAITVATAGFVYSATPVTVPAAQFPGTIDVEACGAATATYVDVITDSSCPNPILSVTRTWTVTDNCGNVSQSCTQTIDVVDRTAPSINCPADLVVDCGDPTDPSATGMATGMDACSTPLIAFTDMEQPGQCGGTKTITRSWTSTDACGNASGCNQIIGVRDITPPTPVCNGITVQLNGQTGTYDFTMADVATMTAGSMDECSAVTATFANLPPPTLDCSNLPSVQITLSVADACMNSVPCTVTVIVEDPTSYCCALAVTCPPASLGTIACDGTIP